MDTAICPAFSSKLDYLKWLGVDADLDVADLSFAAGGLWL